MDPRPYDVETIVNPTQAELRNLALEHTPAIVRSAHGNLMKLSRNKARMAKFTYMLAPEADRSRYSGNVIDPARGRALIDRQADYIRRKGSLIRVDGRAGLGARSVRVQWLYTLEGANIAGMQQVLACPPDVGPGDFVPSMRVVYTPDLYLDDMPGRQAILVDLERWTTHICGADYFGESKKGMLRMLNEWVYRQGGLVLHAGAKAVRVGGRTIAMTIMGLSGTGKTTTTFSKQGELTQPIQDDMVCLWPGGECSITENGCFAKTYGLSEETEPVIYHGTLDPSAWVENVYVGEDGRYDFSKVALSPAEVRRLRPLLEATGAQAANLEAYVSGRVRYEEVVDEAGVARDGWDFVVWTQNGRSIIPMATIRDAADLTRVPTVRSMGILNRDEGPDAATPGIVRFRTPEQAAAYFMLGETTKTSAAGKDRGKTRSPFTQPFFPGAHGLQARRFRELAATMAGTEMWMMNTGYVGGDARDVKAGRALKVRIPHSSSMLEALLGGRVRWEADPDFGYEVVAVGDPANAGLVARVPPEVLCPRRFYEKAGRMAEYRDWVRRMKEERRAFLRGYDVEPVIVQAVG
ncbi:MAG: phosphoenolpyruvate carboxykinase (ATP) [Planctomycetes bacterium]|nr:phosphoenolpyruvate carboxykinase (ATP) [Planctomycetota bacterium]